jgi:uncharacterized membrane protein (UPF0127 family)
MKHDAKLVDANTNLVVIESLHLAVTPWDRFRGLMFRRHTPPCFGLLIQPCRSIHTMWMRLTIDVCFLSQDNVVIGIRSAVPPWRIVLAPKGTKSVLETPSGQTTFLIGTKLLVQCNDRS